MIAYILIAVIVFVLGYKIGYNRGMWQERIEMVRLASDKRQWKP